MDVGTGSGILAVWAAKAGAKRVYAGKQSAFLESLHMSVCQSTEESLYLNEFLSVTTRRHLIIKTRALLFFELN